MPPTTMLPPRYAEPRLVAQGGMAAVFLAEDRVLGRAVAVKVLDDRYAADRAMRRRFVREAKAAARLSGHPHIVAIYDIGEHGDRPFIVMEYLPGGNVLERIRQARGDPELALSWLDQAASALDAAHAMGVIHRDVKPANLVFDARDVLRVADFGIARVVDESTSGEMTAVGTIIGTSGYLSPEQALGEGATAASDVYSLGVVAFELLTGSRPFARESQAAELNAHVSQSPPTPSSLNPALPRAVDAVLARCLAKDPARRYTDATGFVLALRGALASGARRPPPAAPVTPAAAAAPPRALAPTPATRYGAARGRSRLGRAGALLALVAALAAAGAGLAAVVDDGGGAPREALTATPAATTQDPPATTEDPPTTTEDPPATTEDPPATTEDPPVTTEDPPATETDPDPDPQPVSDGLSPAEAAGLNDQGFALMGEGRYTEALPLLRRAARTLRGRGPADPYEGYAYYNLGKTLLELGRCGGAVRALERSLALQPDRRGDIGPDLNRARRCDRQSA